MKYVLLVFDAAPCSATPLQTSQVESLARAGAAVMATRASARHVRRMRSLRGSPRRDASAAISSFDSRRGSHAREAPRPAARANEPNRWIAAAWAGGGRPETSDDTVGGSHARGQRR